MIEIMTTVDILRAFLIGWCSIGAIAALGMLRCMYADEKLQNGTTFAVFSNFFGLENDYPPKTHWVLLSLVFAAMTIFWPVLLTLKASHEKPVA